MFKGWRHTHSDRLTRWLGKAQVEQFSRNMRAWYGPPILVAGVPGRNGVWATRGGDFIGWIEAGQFCSIADFYWHRVKRVWRNWPQRQALIFGGGLANYEEIQAEWNAGKGQHLRFSKTTQVNPLNSVSFFPKGNLPGAGASAANAPGGEVPTRATTGALPLQNAQVSGDFISFAAAEALISNTDPTSLLVYDRIFSVNKTMSSSATEAVTGVPTRYQSTTGGAQNSAEGNFLFMEIIAALSGTAHNWTVCQYTDQGGTTAVNLPSVAGYAGGALDQIGAMDFTNPTATWFAPLATGDTGIKALTQMQCDSAALTGTLNFTMGHPIAWVPLPTARLPWVGDGIWSAFNMARVYDDACLALIEVANPTTSSHDVHGHIELVAS